MTYNKKNIKNKKITILGGGVSGISAAKLGAYLGANIFISDKNNFNTKLIESISPKINHEIGLHSNRCLECDLMILSPGIDPRNKAISSFIKEGINIVSEISEVTINKCYKKLEKIKENLVPTPILTKYSCT